MLGRGRGDIRFAYLADRRQDLQPNTTPSLLNVVDNKNTWYEYVRHIMFPVVYSAVPGTRLEDSYDTICTVTPICFG